MKLLLCLLLATHVAAAQRPQLSADEARRYARAEVLGDWVPSSAAPATIHYRVDPARAGTFATVQAALHQAHDDVQRGRQTASRVVIGIAPGDYAELVFVPPLPTPITLQGLGERAADVRIHTHSYSRMSGTEFARRHTLPPGSPYVDCARRPAIGTDCTAVMWVQNRGFELRRLTIENTYDESQSGNLHQAVTLATEADRVHLDDVRLLGNQDTLYLKVPAGETHARVFVQRSLIEGDVDFIFGAATAYFDKSEIRWVGGARGAASGFVTAASTNLATRHGLVFDDCDFTSDGQGLAATQQVHLGRQWFAGARCSPYGEMAPRCVFDASPIDTTVMRLERSVLEAVGKVAILRSRLGAHIRLHAPWAPWNLNRSDPAYRLAQFTSDDFWQQLQAAGHDPNAMGYRRPHPPDIFLAEHCNTGPGAAPWDCPR